MLCAMWDNGLNGHGTCL